MDAAYMKRALELAKKGAGKTSPNPMVGAVIVKDNCIIGEGYHKEYGGPHAEINALRNAGEKAIGADIYVNLEPCSHYGKTPPCAEVLVKSGIKKAVIAMKDPNPRVSGKGIEILIKNGIEVKVGVLEKEALKLNEFFIKYITKKEPFVISKSAVSLDGKIATTTGESKWITGEDSREYVHNIRKKVSGIMVGIGTILADNPMLTARIEGHTVKSPTAIIVDSHLRIPMNSNLFKDMTNREIIIATLVDDGIKKMQLEDKGVKIITTPSYKNKVDLKYLIKRLGEEDIDSILLEGGSTLNFSALKMGIVDKVMYFIAPKLIGGETSKSSIGGEGFSNLSEAINLKYSTSEKIGEDLLIEAYVVRG